MRDSTAKGLWSKALRFILDEGDEYSDNDGRTCKEVLNLTLTLESSSQSGVEDPINTMASAKEWLYPSKEELASIIFKKHQAPVYEYTYGGRIFNFAGEFDQLNEFVIPLLRKDPRSRRAVISIYNPLKDSSTVNRNTPAMMYMQFRIKSGALHSTTHIRSNEVLFGWPANLFQIFKFSEQVAKELGVPAGNLTIISNSAHVFLEDRHSIKRILNNL
ncbi:MAG: thymidylate synthase [Nanobdellota archaeon]